MPTNPLIELQRQGRGQQLGFAGFKIHGWKEGDPSEEERVTRHMASRGD